MAAIVAGKVLRPRGLKGEVLAEVYLNDFEKLLQYNFYWDVEFLHELSVLSFRIGRPCVLELESIDSVEKAQSLAGKFMYIDSNELPILPDGEDYIANLLGLQVFSDNDQLVGRIIDVHNFGAGDILQIDNGILLPFNDNFVKSVDLHKVVYFSDGLRDLLE
ncbi:ribosome maturation factor RimM [Candidatus Gromoviella agglomerans]|uniref:ribosome maturation factor RimM n=1 Tax=Candidatus Gromoviella agglomerans TaxID=2806609 RepID=UPI001E5784B7|nr:ribosome maturation factor RimM [Candidatus Gromoviella agglomerans]UFX98504.1 Ribosome maturation factor RimM [Candidatus Gromoviella agglomerans]